MLDSALADVALRRRLGIFYTPDEVALAIARWAVRGNVGPVLDPSFGGCSFLRAALTALEEEASESPQSLIYGIDVDPHAKEYVRDLVKVGVPKHNILIRNFFASQPSQLTASHFRSVIGNPPYVRHHWMSADEKKAADDRSSEAHASISGQGSAWSYFVAHALNFLALDGRLAFVLPGSLLHTDYGRDVVALMERHFDQVHLVHIREQLFPNVDEISVIAFCAGRGKGPTEANYSHMPLAELEQFCNGGSASIVAATSWKLHHLTDEEREAYELLRARSDVTTLGRLATIKIGIVTGANDFFVRSQQELAHLGPTFAKSPVLIRKPAMLKGVSWTRKDETATVESDDSTHLLIIRESHRIGIRLDTLIAEAEDIELDTRYKCSLRDPWFALNDVDSPDAFLPYMGTDAPTLSINQTEALCLNNIHRVWFKSGTPGASIAVGSWTTLFQLSAEIQGRAYGGGVLKLEPSEARRLAIPLNSSLGVKARMIDRLAKESGREKARAIADELVLEQAMGMSTSTVKALRSAVQRLRELRKPLPPK
jgi:adenine-specific DNA-methyltransferase